MKKQFLYSIILLCALAIGGVLKAQVPSYVPTDSLVSWWPMNGTGIDASGNSHDASTYYPSNNYPEPITDRHGVAGGACYFDGVDDYFEVPHHIDFNHMPLTISFWMKADCYTEGAKIIDKYCCATWNGWNVQFGSINGIPNSWELSYFTSTCNGIFQSYCNPIEFPIINAFDNQWHHIAFVVDYSGSTVYMDAQVVFTQPWFINGGGDPSPIITQVVTGLPVTIGADGANEGARYHGVLDDMGFWQRALTADEVTQLYGTPSDLCPLKARVFNDFDNDCLLGGCFLGLESANLFLNPGGITLQTDDFGEVFFCDLALPDGAYELAVVTANTQWIPSCDSIISFNLINGAPDTTLMFGLTSDSPCPSPDVSIICPTIRRCSEHTWPIYVHACNNYSGTGVLENAYVLVELDENIIIDLDTTTPFTMENGLYRFELGNINPGHCIDLVINVNFTCDLELGETLCMEATLYPVPECLQDTVPVPGPCELPWDHSSLSVNGSCNQSTGTVSFTVSNNGDDMDCFSEVRVYLDGDLIEAYYIQLSANTDTTFTFPSTEGTWILQADQHPLHPGNSHPNDHVEGCGNVVGQGDGDDDDGDGDTEDDDEWEAGLVDDLPCGDESPFTDEFCGQVVGSFDPNDKQGFPDGIGEYHEILPNGQMQYLIRFQNTGTAPAYTVVIRDTLDESLDIFSVTPGASSHDYSFTIYGERVLQWTFNNIMLPDSFSNEEASHGFITYTVNQLNDLADGTAITNSAAIYFDSNEPVITNTTIHTINHCLFSETQAELAVTSCGPYTAPDGQLYSASGTYTAVLANSAGCDSTILISLTVNPIATTTENVNVCSSELPYIWNGNSLDATGTYSAMLQTSAGCDSSATINLVVNPVVTTTESVSMCSSELPYIWNGNNLDATGTYSAMLQTSAGCDSSATINLVVNPVVTTTENVNICSSELPYIWNGNNLDSTGTYSVLLQTSAGCDSAATINLAATSVNATIAVDSNGTLIAGPEGLAYQWYDCTTNLPVVENGTGITFSATDGSYLVEVSDGACAEQTECIELVGVKELKSARILLFPVPATEKITALWFGNTTDYSIYSPDGRLMLSGKLYKGTNHLDIGVLSRGTYMLKAGMELSRFTVE